MLLMVENDIRGGICHTIHRYVEANNKYMKNYDKNKKSLSCYSHKKFKRSINHGLLLEKVHRFIKFNQKACLNSYIDMNRELRK